MNTLPLQIRPSDRDSLGHINNAAYMTYVELAIAEFLGEHGFAVDWRDGSPYQWLMEELAVEYRLAASYGDQIAAHVWLAEADERRPVFGCQIYRADGARQQAVIRLRSRWRRWHKSTSEAMKLPQTFLATAGQEAGDLPRPFSVPVEAPQAHRYRWRHQIQRNEVGLGGWIHPHVLFEWVEESILHASDEAGWPVERCLASDFVVFQMRHDASIVSWPLLGDTIEVVSRLINVRRLRGTWHNEIRSAADNRLLATDYSTGIFLNLEGRPTSAPPGMMEALQDPAN
ncbi:MAG: acyl-[acyl-carrier-protein] thioesterase [Chloroflexota bacterium]|jgi:YbgC/YbaW family acyl-CoA thioester hydrolase